MLEYLFLRDETSITGVEEYCDADREVKKMIRNAKRKFEKRLADDKSGNSRPFYAYEKREQRAERRLGHY